jgi:hypothetical protein
MRKERIMLKNIALVTVLVSLAFLVSACGHYGHWCGPGEHHTSHGSHENHAQIHYRGCGH